MSRVFLLSSNVSTDPYPVYPLGMALIASALAEAGHEVRQFDYLVAGSSDALLRRSLEGFGPDCVCFSLRNIDNVDSFSAEEGWYLAEARRLMEIVREAGGCPVIVGGPAFSIMPEAILEYLGADYGVAGEGERAVCELIKALEEKRPVPPLHRGGPPADRLRTSPPLLEPDFVDFYLRASGMANLQTKRGCPHGCVYCTYPSLEGTRFRPRDPAEVADDLEAMRRDFGIESVFFTDSVFNDPQGHYLAVAEELIRRETGVRWCGFFRPQGIGREELALLKRSGLYAIELGTDASSDATLEGLGKGFSFEEVLQIHRLTVAEEIPCAHFIMFGGPGETAETLREGLENIERLAHGVVFGFSGIRILPGTPLAGRAVAEGLLDPEDSLLRPRYYFSPQVDPQAMNAAVEAAFRGRRDRIFPPSRGQESLAVMQRFGFRGILWDKLVSFPGARRSKAG